MSTMQPDVAPPVRTTPRVSVVVPSCNHVKFIERCLKSIFRQTLPSFELLVIDDGSQDESVALIDRILKDCPFPCEFIARRNLGLCKTLNEGFAKTSGDYFCYLGSDDVWFPAFLASRVALLEAKPNAPLAYGPVFVIDEKDRITNSTRDSAACAEGTNRAQLWRGVGIFSSSVCFRRAKLSAQPSRGWSS